MRRIFAFIFFASLLMASCTKEGKKYIIGVSQCSEDIWRDKQNSELRMGAYCQENVELRFATAYDSDTRQVQQIDSLVATGIDLLIVAPNQVATISPAIDRAYDKGIPVIVFERKTNSRKYTAYIGADNYEMGCLMGEYIASKLNGKGTVMEIMGLKGSSPAIERHNGFSDALKQHSGIKLAPVLQGDWTENSAYKAVKECKEDLGSVDFIFGQNDRMAIGARKAMLESVKQPLAARFCGIDGLPGKDGGIQLVRDSVLDATYIYPTHGDRLIQIALDILEGKPYDKEVMLMSALVTHDNANVLLMQSDEIVRQAEYLDELHLKSNGYLKQLANQRTIILLTLGMLLFLLIAASALYLYLRQKARLGKERRQMERAQLDFYTQISHELRTPLTLIEGPLTQLSQTPYMENANGEAKSLFDIVRRNTSQLTGLVNKLLDAQAGNNTQEMTYEQIDAVTIEQKETPQTVVDTLAEDSPTLLIVDDNADIRAYLRTILQGKYKLVEASDGKQGIEVANAEVPDLIISDVMMPVMNGLEFCQRVKDDFVTSHIPVILLTARALNKHQVEGYRSGADAYITKPFQADLLLVRIDNLLKSRHLLRNLWSSEQKEEKAEEPKAEVKENAFIIRFKAVVEEKMSDSDLSVEDIGADMNLSRVQLYRKVKALTGYSPVDMLRKARLSEAYRQLLNSDLSVSEIAYKVGFTSPSYFTKCFKDEYGKVPGEVRTS